MIHCIKQPLPSPLRKQIREWLQEPAARLFLDQVAALAAAETAEGANLMLDGAAQPSEIDEAKDHFKKAAHAMGIVKIMQDMQGDTFQFMTVELGPQPTATATLTED